MPFLACEAVAVLPLLSIDDCPESRARSAPAIIGADRVPCPEVAEAGKEPGRGFRPAVSRQPPAVAA